MEVTPKNPHPASLTALFESLTRNRGLIAQMIKRDILARYRGSIMGLAWSFVTPLLMLAVYTFVFSVVFKARWNVPGDQSQSGYAIMLFSGMIVHGLFAECVNRAPTLILNHASYVKKVVFPLEVLPWISMGTAIFHSFTSIAVLALAIMLLQGGLSPTLFLLPLVLFPLVILTIGISWFLASAGVYLRDIGQSIGLLTTILLFMSPVFFPVSALPERFQSWMLLNPLTFIIEQTREVMIWGRAPDWSGLAIYLCISALIAWLGFYWFQRTRKGFADVL